MVNAAPRDDNWNLLDQSLQRVLKAQGLTLSYGTLHIIMQQGHVIRLENVTQQVKRPEA